MVNQSDAGSWLHLVQEAYVLSITCACTSFYLLASQVLRKLMLPIKVCSCLQLSSREMKLDLHLNLSGRLGKCMIGKKNVDLGEGYLRNIFFVYD